MRGGQVDPGRFDDLLCAMAHRGPDGTGTVAWPGIRIGHRRLAIVDVKGGAQPMLNEFGTLALVANGEIYNADRLRSSLTPVHAFRTHSDSEVALHLYESRGMLGLRALQGMYALVIAGPEKLLAVRDPLGIKPLYFTRSEGAIWIASEISVLHTLPDADIFPVPPGGALDETGRVFPAIPLTLPRAENHTPERAMERIRSSLEAAVESHLMSDVPVGTFLSGGLDSSIVTALARRHLGELHTFATGLPDSEDLAAAGRLASILGTVHHEHHLSADAIMEDLPEIVTTLESWDRDLVRSAIPCWYVARLAARHVKVVLTGEGADELFGGYAYLAGVEHGATLHRELVRLVRNLHHLNLQRVDRMTMRHGLEARVPFLDLGVVEAAMSADPRHKLMSPDRPGKWLLRQAFDGLLPPLFLWRTKLQFDSGTGVAGVVAGLARGRARLAEEREHALSAGVHLPRDEEEAWYYRIFRRTFDPARVRTTLGRWDPVRPRAGTA